MADSAPDASFPWVETGRGCYRQQLDSLGIRWSNWYTDDLKWRRAPVSLASYCKIRCPTFSQEELEQRLRKAWIALRYYNPGIASGLAREEGCEALYRTYKTPTEDELSQWTWTTFRVHNHKTVDVLCQEAGLDFLPVLNFCPSPNGDNGRGSGGELLLICHHFFNDGRGTFLLWDSFLKLLQNPQEVVFEDQSPYLPPARDRLLGLPARPTVPAYTKAVNAVGSAFTPQPVALPLQTDSNKVRQGNVTMRHAMTREQTSALVAACRARGITVTAAFRAAHMLSCQAAWNRSCQEPRDQYMSFEMFDTRPWFREPFDPRRNFGTDYHGLVPCKFNLGNGKSFGVLANEVDAWLKSVRQEYEADPAGQDAILFVTQSLLGGATPDPLPPSTPIFGSYGIIDGHFMDRVYGDEIFVDDVWSGVPCNSGSINGSWIWTFDGRFNITFTYNAAYYSTSMFEQLMSETVRKLSEGLGIM